MRKASSRPADQLKVDRSGRKLQLTNTLSKTHAVLQSFLKNGEIIKNASILAQRVAAIVGVDPSLYRKKSTPHKELFDQYAIKLCVKLPKSILNASIPDDVIRLQLSEATHRITVLEKILGDLPHRTQPVATPVSRTDANLYDFEKTCHLVEKILLENQYLYFDGGKLMTSATMTSIPAELSDAKTCKPFLDWRHARTKNIGSLSTTELEQSLRPSASGRVDESD
ncbi:hypothetical protein [Pseudomonas syringae]|uniref:hypothetical protein n=1 Tax=Pseudomonas syringae TaxID=317 RepID=UPI000357DFA8|nr:hypothetical protein [Pseudomonas syringae]AQL36281.1 hypothetical protein JN853_07305 [Pseudomonas syringae pv. actinidiae ICMP 9853]EPM54834.1 hypothetical protein A256_09160 [Pseudomonas syringae pv. actinidiae ICMP 19103]NVL26979.1 hypothetical protein [Pseudomonas syringae pv. actinidiae]EPN04997.1 hypothetical protein A253_08950 [Pseudomonas syringae pv. actinidiae ICMP 19102]MDG6386785.1 hypothetical protein [Pseudomonas syringae]